MMNKHLLINYFICLFSSFLFSQNTIKNPSLDKDSCIHGKVFTYYSNGQPKSYVTYQNGFIYGGYEKYYRNGKIKENGFLDDVNSWNLLFQPSKPIKNKYKRNQSLKYSLQGEIYPIKTVPYGKCKCLDDNNSRIKSLLVGDWIKDKMEPFSKSDQIIDSIYKRYSTRITFFEDDTFQIIENNTVKKGIYILQSNILDLELLNEKGESEYFFGWRWPKKTLYPNSTGEHFKLELIELMEVLSKENQVKLSNVVVKFKRIL